MLSATFIKMNKEEQEALSLEQKVDLIRHGNIWCWKTFFIGLVKKIFSIIFSREMIVFVLASIALHLRYQDNKETTLHWVSWIILGVIFILAEAIRILVGQKTNLNIDAKIGATAGLNVTGDLNKAASQIITEVKK